MSKYSSKLKLKVVNYYLNNNCSWQYVTDKLDIPAWTSAIKWVRKYEEHGASLNSSKTDF